MLPHGQRGEEQVVLVHICRETEESIVGRLPIHKDIALEFLIPQRNTIEQAGFAGAWGKEKGGEGGEIRPTAISKLNGESR